MADAEFTPANNLAEDLAALIGSGDSAVEIAEKIARVARSSAPRESGNYAAGIKVERFKTGARVIAENINSAALEFGVPSRNMPAQFPLRRAVDSLGLKFRKGKT